MHRFEGKTAVVTGGGTDGIGRATAARLVNEGAHVFITGRRESELTDAVAAIGRTSRPYPATSPSWPISTASTTRSRPTPRARRPVRERRHRILRHDRRDHTRSTSTTSSASTSSARVFTVQKAIPLLNQGASIIINASTAAERGAATMGAYAASKAAIRSFARTWANELKDRGVRVNAISPGPTDTSGVAELVGPETVAAYNENLSAALPIGRMAHFDEMAGVVAFLASGTAASCSVRTCTSTEVINQI